MKKSKLLGVFSAVILTGLMIVNEPLASAQTAEPPAATPPPVPSEELPAGSQVLASGPVHEAFAKPVTMDPQAPLVVPQAPPDNLPEVPPAEKPAGANMVWVPGYWAWDTDRTDFIWVSGCWRNAPPNTYWMPGHWLTVGTGWEWISGFWKPIDTGAQQAIEYLPAPPASVEVEPVGTAPSPDQIWVPGCWYWATGQYTLRHGYWTEPNVGWAWVPSHYVWTPRGYIFCPGHWDYDLDNRGVLFAPVYFPPAARGLSSFVYSPGICIDLGVLQLNLFCAPRSCRYYFGDYYNDSYRRAGIYPWYQCQTVNTWYDPLFVYNRWHYRQTDPHWADNQAHQYSQLRANRNLRPARTYSELKTQMSHESAARRSGSAMLQPLKSYAASQSTPLKFERLTATDRQQIRANANVDSQIRTERTRLETPATTKGTKASSPPRESAKEAQPTPTTSHFWNRSTPPEIVKPGPVQATRPEREVVPGPSYSRSSESRYVAKEAPTSPSQERIRSSSSTNQNGSQQWGSGRGNSGNGNSNDGNSNQGGSGRGSRGNQ